jgi:hypothetical protein
MVRLKCGYPAGRKAAPWRTLGPTTMRSPSAPFSCLHVLMQVTLAIVIFVLLVGCSTRQQHKPWNDPVAWRPGTPVADFLYPDDNEKILNETQKEKLQQIRLEWHPVQLSTPYDADPTLRELYLDWYGKGYTFFEASGMQFLPPYNPPDTAAQRAKADGWRAGQFEASLKQVGQLFDRLDERIRSGQMPRHRRLGSGGELVERLNVERDGKGIGNPSGVACL